eukprot:5925824-Pleurochrysis_carterae.AAC.1
MVLLCECASVRLRFGDSVSMRRCASALLRPARDCLRSSRAWVRRLRAQENADGNSLSVSRVNNKELASQLEQARSHSRAPHGRVRCSQALCLRGPFRTALTIATSIALPFSSLLNCVAANLLFVRRVQPDTCTRPLVSSALAKPLLYGRHPEALRACTYSYLSYLVI